MKLLRLFNIILPRRLYAKGVYLKVRGFLIGFSLVIPGVNWV